METATLKTAAMPVFNLTIGNQLIHRLCPDPDTQEIAVLSRVRAMHNYDDCDIKDGGDGVGLIAAPIQRRSITITIDVTSLYFFCKH